MNFTFPLDAAILAIAALLLACYHSIAYALRLRERLATMTDAAVDAIAAIESHDMNKRRAVAILVNAIEEVTNE